ncbi:MAG: hypothetical protein VB858_06415 [Planctomycetaceae bacterium]
MTIELTALIRCPQCCTPVILTPDLAICRNDECRLAFPVTRGIAEMLIDNARGLPADEWARRTAVRED